MAQQAPKRPTWLASGRPIARYVAQPMVRFLHIEAAVGVLLVVATIAALIWANSPWQASYEQLWTTEVLFEAGPIHLAEDLRHWVNDGLMALFFFVVGLEIKRELVTGQLADRRDAVLPVVAALGGMVVPAAIFFSLNAGTDGTSGWGIPMATDIAFAVGMLTLLGPRIPTGLKILLLGLAIADDIGAIIVIAVFYTEDLQLTWLAGAAAGLVAVALLQRARVWFTPTYVVLGVLVWACMLESGIHATIAGVALGLLTPARPLLPEHEADRLADRLSPDTNVTAAEIREVGFAMRESVSVGERLEDLLHPWTGYVIIPIFALANAGIPLSSDALSDAVSSRITLGVVLGLVVGKLVGVSAATWLAVKAGLGRLPVGTTWSQVVGMAGVAGIGFTVSIFVSGLAYTDISMQEEAKVGVLAASLLAAGLGTLLLLRATRTRQS